MARLARSLETLRNQINAKSPNRNKASDGWIGDAAHAARGGADVSQHNPNSAGVVCALDITHDPANGVDCQRLMDEIKASGDPRVFYTIHNRRIDNSNGTRTAYNGSNPHVTHLHVSVRYTDPARYDDPSPWSLPMLAGVPVSTPGPPPAPAVTWRSIGMGESTQLHTKGEQVRIDQANLVDTGFPVEGGVDGYCGPATVATIRRFQVAAGLVVDGICGPKTRAALRQVPSWRHVSTLVAQRRLGHYGHRLVLDGINGPKTKAAVKAFQSRFGLEADGIVGPVTWTALHTR